MVDTDGDLRGRATPRPSRAGPRRTREGAAGDRGRRGKTVTAVSNLPLSDVGIAALAGRLKKRCGVGGSAKDGVIEIQGDHRDTVMQVLAAEGLDAVLAGG